jgi:hypothetical protein
MVNSYAEVLMIQMINERIQKERCIPCEIKADIEILRKQDKKKKNGR